MSFILLVCEITLIFFLKPTLPSLNNLAWWYVLFCISGFGWLITDLGVYVQERNWCVYKRGFPFLCFSYSSFGVKIMLASILWKTLCRIGAISPLHIWKNYSMNTYRPGVFFLGRILVVDTILLMGVGISRFFCLFLCPFW